MTALIDLEGRVEEGMCSLGLAASPAMLGQFAGLVGLLAKWNRTYNLTAVRDTDSVVCTHLLDSLAAAPYLDGERGIDVGTGAGFPGIPLAIALPERRVTLLDSSQKKTAFLRQVVAELKLANAEVVCARVEAWNPVRGYDWVISRAFADLSLFAASCAHLALPSGVLVAMKGVRPDKEIDALPGAFRVRRTIRLRVPGLDAERHLVLVERP